MGWNRRYFEDLLIKYYYNNNKNNIVNDICKTRTFIPEFYIVGPLKKNWNPLLRTQWSYLLDRDLVYNTPFGNKKYEKLINSNYVKDIAETNNNSGSVVNGNDYFSEAYLCAFSVYFRRNRCYPES